MKKKMYTLSFLACSFLFLQHAAAQNTGGVWLSGSNIVSDGTGPHTGETPILALEDSIIDLISSTSGGGAGAGKANVKFSDFKFRKTFNDNTLHFLQLTGNGAVSSNLSFKFYRQDNAGRLRVYFTIELIDAIVTKDRLLVPECSGNNCPAAYEEIALTFNRIKYTNNLTGSSVELTVNSHL